MHNRRKRPREREGDDEFDRRPPRRRYEEPVASRLRRELMVIAEEVSSLDPKHGDLRL
jgi:nuclear cap-binding protein subunit 1